MEGHNYIVSLMSEEGPTLDMTTVYRDTQLMMHTTPDQWPTLDMISIGHPNFIVTSVYSGPDKVKNRNIDFDQSLFAQNITYQVKW